MVWHHFPITMSTAPDSGRCRHSIPSSYSLHVVSASSALALLLFAPINFQAHSLSTCDCCSGDLTQHGAKCPTDFGFAETLEIEVECHPNFPVDPFERPEIERSCFFHPFLVSPPLVAVLKSLFSIANGKNSSSSGLFSGRLPRPRALLTQEPLTLPLSPPPKLEPEP
jgi:hypothetical protein